MKKSWIYLLLGLVLASCHSSKKTTVSSAVLEKTGEKKPPVSPVYRGSNTVRHDLVHTRLDVRFDWEKKQLHGQAQVILTPHFYPSDRLFLDARGMDIREVSLLETNKHMPLKYNYHNDSLDITLDRSYRRGESFSIFIDYTAKPEELKQGGSAAIMSDKGLYFINADGKDPDMPKQIWTQGETQSNSAWFPTIDSPNERMTQEIYITVDSSYTTLSNGLLISSVKNAGGTRTDYWKQSLPAAPYLTMMAIGRYAIVKDAWRNKEVSYYVEPEYEPYARQIFGHTPEMLEFFSKTLGVDYPWEKFSQVVVREYVSGAMENTTAVVHGEFMQQDSREMLDKSYEDIIAHELFHQWFGDLVTCESWSNIPLHESFATYGQYLWNEYKYGRDEADYGLQQDLNEYITLGRGRSPHLVRFDYENREDLFDVVSYQKGGRILHMLRKVVGDEAFLASLKLYLNTNKFKAAEVHQLRLAFEEITGQDLNWFFNEWFYNGGHPELKISYAYNDSLKQQFVFTEQNQDFEKTPLFRMPLAVDLYYNNSVIRKEVLLSQARDTFVFGVPVRPDLVNMDAEKMLVAVKQDLHKPEEWMFMFEHGPLYMDRYESLQKVSRNYKAGSAEARMVQAALGDKYWNIRLLAIRNIETLARDEASRKVIKEMLTGLVEKDPKADVRAAALKALARYYNEDKLTGVFIKAAGDSSYDVVGEAIRSYLDAEPETGMTWIKQFEQVDNRHVASVLAGIYVDKGTDENNAYFKKAIRQAKGFGRYQLMSEYARFLSRCHPATVEDGLPVLEEAARSARTWWVRLSAIQAMSDLQKSCTEKSEAIRRQIQDDIKSGKTAIEIQKSETEQKQWENLEEIIRLHMQEIKRNETDQNLKKIYTGGSD